MESTTALIYEPSPQSATTEHLSTTPDRPPDWIEYPAAEADLFAALNGPDGYARVLASDYGYQFGIRVADDEIVADFAEALFPKAAGVLCEQGTRQVFGDAHLFALCQQWARHWCELQQRAEQWKLDRSAAVAKNAADRLAYRLRQYGGWVGFAKGNLNSALKRAMSADERAIAARKLRDMGWTLRKIAEAFGVDIRTVSRWMKRQIGAAVAAVTDRLKSWTSAKCWSGTDPKNFDPSTRTAFAKCPTDDDPTHSGRNSDEITAREARAVAELAARFPNWAENLAKLTS